MEKKDQFEVWLRGPVPGIPALLQPVVHALLQAQEEINALDKTFPDKCLWEKPAGVASVGFHMQHLKGVLDRLFTYARNESLNEIQLSYLKHEGNPPFSDCTFSDLLEAFNEQINNALKQLHETDEIRLVGRAQIPSTVAGLLFHAAEHTQRHLGQLLVTAKVVSNLTSV